MRRHTAWGFAVAALTLGWVSGCSGSSESPSSTPSPSARTTAAEDVERTECPPAAFDGADRRAVIGVARCAVIAYTEFSYRDRDHRAWIDRVERYATETFVADLRELFGPDVPAEIELWKRLVEAGTVARTVVTSATAARADDTFTVGVTAGLERRTKADPEWEPYRKERTFEVTLVPVGRDWRVADIR